MTDWPDDWFRDAQQPGADPRAGEPAGSQAPAGQPASGQPAAGQPGATIGKAAGASADRTVRLSHRSEARDTAPPGGQAGSEASTTPGRSGWPEQPATRMRNPQGPPSGFSPLSGGAGGSGGVPRVGWRRWLRPRPILAAIAILVSLAIIGTVTSYFYLDSKLTRKNVLVDYNGRPPLGSGTNWLITGSDSRQGLSTAQERRLHTGVDISGRRSDTIMVLHMPAGGGRPVLVSLPRDSYVPIPGHGSDKINAAFALGGPRLLAETVQNVTGLRIEHYMGIGFGGFVRVVNAVGGVRLCLKAPLVDPKAGLHLHKGCQTLDGAEALGFVRSREQFATADLQRIQDQRIFLAALLRKLTSTGVLLNPFASLPAASGVAGTLTVDKGTHLLQLIKVAFALRNPITTTVPISGGFRTSTGEDALLWNRTEALQLFRDLNTGKAVPKNLITGSKQAG